MSKRASLSGKPTAAEWRQVARSNAAVVTFESIEGAPPPGCVLASVVQLSFHGACVIAPGFFDAFPQLQWIRFSGSIQMPHVRRRLKVRRVELTDVLTRAAELLGAFDVERLEISGGMPQLATAVLPQSRLRGLRLQDTRLELGEIAPLLPRLKVLCLYRVSQRTYDWLPSLTGLEMLSVAYQKSFEDLSPLANLRSLRILDISSQRKLKKFESLGELRNLTLLSFLNVGVIPTLSWLKAESRLAILKILGDCTVADGQLAFLEHIKSLRHVSIEKRRNYDADPNGFSRIGARGALALGESLLPAVWQ